MVEKLELIEEIQGIEDFCFSVDQNSTVQESCKVL